MTVRHKPWLAALLALTLSTTAWAAGFAEREEVQAFIAQMHEQHAFDPAELTRLFARIEPEPRVIRLITPPSTPGARSWRKYRDTFVSESRIDKGLDYWQENAAWLENARRVHGVPEEIIVAIIGIETIYGRQMGSFPTLAALATLAFDYPPRAELFRKELEALLLLARESERSPLSYTGSYAGALGIAQFLPSSIRNWGDDFDLDGKRDLAESDADAIGSVANFLARHGWQPGEAPVVPAEVSGERFQELIDEGILPRRTPAELTPYGVLSASDAPQRPCALIDLATPGQATEYWLGYTNFYVITRYNRSSFYAMAVITLANALKAAREAAEADKADEVDEAAGTRR